MIAAFIIGCEIGFWIFVLSGLAVRYLLGQRKAGAVLLACAPLVDLALIAATVFDLRGGAEAGTAHGLAAVYIGVSVAYGHRLIRWADERFRYRFAGGPRPEPAPRHGRRHANREIRLWFLHLVAWAIGCAILLGMIWLVGDADRTEALFQMMQLWSVIVGIDFVWSFSYLLWPRKEKAR